MALFSFRHSVKTFSDKRSAEARAAKHGQTAAHLRYITRPQAARVVLRSRLAHRTDEQLATAVEHEAEARKGRVCERFILALPFEATPTQREALVSAFAEALTGGVAGYVAAIHDHHGNDTRNPHAHIAAFDVQVKGGGRGRPRSTIGMARKNAVEEAAARWADLHNRLMTEWGHGPESHITHLSYEARGIDRIPQIHEGAASRQMLSRGEHPAFNAEWLHLDGGHSRAEANALIREINKLKKEENDDEADPTNGLGSRNEGNRGKRRGRCEDDRKSSGSTCRGAGSSAPPWAATGESGSQHEASSDTANTFSTEPLPFLAGRESQLPPPPFLDQRHLSRWSRVRRVYRELVMLRDTLRARFLGERQRSHTASVVAAEKEARPLSDGSQHHRE